MSQHSRNAALLLVLLSLAPFAAQAKVFRCVAANGELTFSQTPCPVVDKEVTEQRTESRSDDETGDDGDDGVDIENLYASTTPQASQSGREETESESVQRAPKQDADSRDERLRLHCRQNFRAQITNIDTQMGADYSAAHVELLKKKRRDFEKRLREC